MLLIPVLCWPVITRFQWKRIIFFGPKWVFSWKRFHCISLDILFFFLINFYPTGMYDICSTFSLLYNHVIEYNNCMKSNKWYGMHSRNQKLSKHICSAFILCFSQSVSALWWKITWPFRVLKFLNLWLTLRCLSEWITCFNVVLHFFNSIPPQQLQWLSAHAVGNPYTQHFNFSSIFYNQKCYTTSESFYILIVSLYPSYLYLPLKIKFRSSRKKTVWE